MGLWTTDNVCQAERERAARRRHERKMWLITLAEVAVMLAFAAGAVWLIRWVGLM